MNNNVNRFTLKPFVLTNIVKKYTNLENEKKRKIRELKDTSTKCFVNIFFESNDILLKFVFWVYHKINCKLTNIEKEICNQDERVIFFFKGGNIMFLWRKRFEEIFGGVDQDISAKTSISDSDFALYILTKDERRYNEIYSIINRELIIQLEEIGLMFDNLFIKAINPANNLVNSTNNLNKKNYTTNSLFDCKEFEKDEKKIFDNFFKYFYTNEKLERLKQNLKDELEKLKTDNNNFYEEKNYEIFRYNIPDDEEYNINIIKRKSLIIRPEDNVPQSFSLTNYASKKFHYVTVNANIFNNLSKAGHLVGFDLYRIKFNTIIDHIFKAKKSNPNTNANNFNTQITQTNFGIPSEFIDISVSKFYDLNLQKLREDFYYRHDKNTVISNKFAVFGSTLSDGTIISSIRTMQIKYIVDDLLVNLFLQNYYNPMIDPKYEKRLFRIFFFYIGNNLINKRQIIPYNIFDFIDPSKIDSYNIFYNFFLLPQNNLDINYIINMMGKFIYNFFNIKNDYDDLQYLLQFTILFNKIIDINEVLSNFIEYYNYIYNIIDNNNTQEFILKFNKFKNDLNKNFKKAYDYFISSELASSSMFEGGGENANNSNANSKKNTPLAAHHHTNTTNSKKMNNKNFLNKLFDIGDGVKLEYKNIYLTIKYQKRKFYPSFEIDDDM